MVNSCPLYLHSANRKRSDACGVGADCALPVVGLPFDLGVFAGQFICSHRTQVPQQRGREVCRRSARSMPSAEKAPGMAGTMMVGIDRSRASSVAWSGPAPP